MSIIFFLTKIPKLSRGEKPKISKKEFLNNIKKFITPKKRNCFNDLFLLEEIECFLKNNKNNLINILKKLNIKKKVNNSKISTNFLIKKWYKKLYNSDSLFLKEWAKTNLNLMETKTAILSLKTKQTSDEFLIELNNSFDSTFKLLKNNSNKKLILLKKKFKWTDDVLNITHSKNTIKAEFMYNSLQLKIIYDLEFELIKENFSIDKIIATYLKLRIFENEYSYSKKKGINLINKILKQSNEVFLCQK